MDVKEATSPKVMMRNFWDMFVDCCENKMMVRVGEFLSIIKLVYSKNMTQDDKDKCFINMCQCCTGKQLSDALDNYLKPSKDALVSGALTACASENLEGMKWFEESQQEIEFDKTLMFEIAFSNGKKESMTALMGMGVNLATISPDTLRMILDQSDMETIVLLFKNTPVEKQAMCMHNFFKFFLDNGYLMTPRELFSCFDEFFKQ